MIKVSIITIGKNVVNDIERTIKSVVEQSYGHIEYIVIDGNSNDGTQEIIEKYKESIHVYVSEKDTGIYNAMNKGVQWATGEWVLFINAGDYLITSNVIGTWVHYLSTTEAGICFGRILWDSPRDFSISVSEHAYLNKSWQLIDNNFPHPATFYRHSEFKKIGWFDEQYQIMADYELNLRSLVFYKIKYSYYPIITTVFNAGGVSNSGIYNVKIGIENQLILDRYFPVALLKLKRSSPRIFKQKNFLWFINKWFKTYLNRAS